MSVIRSLLSVALTPLLLSVVSAIGCYLLAGPTLGMFLGGVVMVALLTPTLVLTADGWRTRGIVLVAILVPFWAAWLWATFRTDTRLTEWLACCLALSAWAAALAGLSVAFRAARLPTLACSTIVTLAGLAWLTWPIWMSRTWDGAQSQSTIMPFVAVHPAMAVNGQVFRQFGTWSEQSIAYRLTDLYQNVPYALPKSIWPCVLVHGAAGAAFIGLSAWLERRRITAPPPEPALPTTS